MAMKRAPNPASRWARRIFWPSPLRRRNSMRVSAPASPSGANRHRCLHKMKRAVKTAYKEAPVMSPEQDHGGTQVLRGGAGNVDKIRDILFGTQMRDYESRFNRLE